MSSALSADQILLARAGLREELPMPAYASVDDWAKISGLSRSRTYALLAEGKLRAKRIGARTLVDVRFGLEWIASQPDVNLSGSDQKLAETFS